MVFVYLFECVSNLWLNFKNRHLKLKIGNKRVLNTNTRQNESFTKKQFGCKTFTFVVWEIIKIAEINTIELQNHTCN